MVLETKRRMKAMIGGGNKIYSASLPLPPFAEQNRIVKKIEELMKLCDELQASKIENEKLLQGALRDALRKEELI